MSESPAPEEEAARAAEAEAPEEAQDTVPWLLRELEECVAGGGGELDFMDREVSAEETGLLCGKILEAAEASRPVGKLVLKRCGLSLDGLPHLAGLLRAGGISGESPLCALSLSGSDFSLGGLGEPFLDALKLGKRLKCLDLSCCSLETEGLAALCRVLGMQRPEVNEPPILEELSLGCNRLRPEGARRLSDCLATNMALRKLDLKANELGHEGAVILVEGLRANMGRIKDLDVSQNELRLPGATLLVDFFEMQEFTFIVQLVRHPMTVAGLVFDEEMLVTQISKNSAAQTWNHAHPAQAVAFGDRILRVNSFESKEEMAEELQFGEDLEVTLVRKGGLERLDLCHNVLTLQGATELRERLGCPASGDIRLWQLPCGGRRSLWLSAH